MVLGAGQLGAGQAAPCRLRPLHAVPTLASLGFPTAWLPQMSQTACMKAEGFLETTTVTQGEAMWLFQLNLGSHGMSLLPHSNGDL